MTFLVTGTNCFHDGIWWTLSVTRSGAVSSFETIQAKAQMVHGKVDGPDNIAETIGSLSLESAIVVIGTVVEAPNVKLGGVELQIQSIEVCSVAESPPPFLSIHLSTSRWTGVSSACVSRKTYSSSDSDHHGTCHAVVLE